ncbi:hypothetical protein DQW71_20975 [Shigella sonnei]|nr:hypothetical protein [Shigella sonnei]
MILIMGEQFSLIFLSIIRWMDILSWKGAMLFVMAFQVSLRGYLKKYSCSFIIESFALHRNV